MIQYQLMNAAPPSTPKPSMRMPTLGGILNAPVDHPLAPAQRPPPEPPAATAFAGPLAWPDPLSNGSSAARLTGIHSYSLGTTSL